MKPLRVEASTSEAAEAWSNSFLADLPATLANLLLEGSSVQAFPADELILRGKSTPGQNDLFVIIDGLVRGYLVGPAGRQATVRYATHGDVIGIPPLIAVSMDIWAEAVIEVNALRLSGPRFRALAERNIELAWPIARYLTQQVVSTNEVLAADIFMPVRARVARHLLDLAQRRRGELFVSARHQDLADAVGSVREVVSREMKRLHEEGMVRRDQGGSVIVDAAALHAVATGVE